MRIAVLFSGGKDSTFATYVVKRQGWEVKYLITMQPPSSESWMFHHPCTELTKLQAEAMETKQVLQRTAGEKEEELKDLIAVLKPIVDNGEIDAIVTGAIASNYQKDRVDALCKDLGVKHISPLWHKDPAQLVKEQIEAGMEIIFTSVASGGFDQSWLGRKLNLNALEDLNNLNKKFGVHISGEGGEYESFVCDCPMFKKRIELANIKRIWDDKTMSGYITADGMLKEK